jgi:hypothetical protein
LISQLFLGNGVAITPSAIHKGDNVTVVYNGLLSKDGASELYLHSGYNQDWSDLYDHQLVSTNRGWETTFSANNAANLNFCFKDSAGHWDNNNGRNWSVRLI